MDDLLREAIADAKAVRETALENAKIALEEAFTPRLQSMLSKKIAAESEDAEENEMDAEESEDHEEMRGMEEEEAEEMEMDAEESEMDAEESEDHEEMREESEDAEETEDAEEEDSVEESEDAEEEDSVEESEDAEEEDSVEEQEDAEEEDELDLESVLAELEKDLDDEDQVEEMEDKDEEEMDESEDKEEDEKMDENDVSSDIGKSDNKVNPKANDSTGAGQGPEGEGSDKKAGTELVDHKVVKEEEDAEESDLDLDEVLRALTEEEAEEQDAEENEKLKSEIKEHRKVIHFMRSKLNEVNLLNAKLLFSNKLFRAFGLNNNQKLKVVETFDRTKNLREVKLVYATLAESFKRPGKRLSESVTKGSSSKPVRSTKPVKEVLSEGQELRNRFKKLANIL